MGQQRFAFKQFTIEQSGAAFKVGTDGCLLGAWIEMDEAQRILDVGSGSGVIALMLAQRSSAQIIGVEIDPQSWEQANYNAGRSPWKERITLIHASLQEMPGPAHGYDLIVSNPPYFKSSTLSGEHRQDQARHEKQLRLAELFIHARRLSTPTGRLAIVIPADRESEAMDSATREGWYLKRITRIRPTAGKDVNRLLTEWCSEPHESAVEETWTLYDPHPHYSKEVRSILGPFYLHL